MKFREGAFKSVVLPDPVLTTAIPCLLLHIKTNLASIEAVISFPLAGPKKEYNFSVNLRIVTEVPFTATGLATTLELTVTIHPRRAPTIGLTLSVFFSGTSKIHNNQKICSLLSPKTVFDSKARRFLNRTNCFERVIMILVTSLSFNCGWWTKTTTTH